MASIRSAIVANLKTAIEAITIAGGYQNDIGAVRLWGAADDEQGPYPSCTVVMNDEDATERTTPVRTRHLTGALEVTVPLPADSATPGWSLIESLLADVEKAVMVDPTRGGHAIDTIVEGSAIARLDREGGVFLGADVQVRVVYRSAWDDPSGAL